LQLARQFPGEAQFQFGQSKTFSRSWKSKTKIKRAAAAIVMGRRYARLIPKGLNHPAQGCEERATLGKRHKQFQP
jgi:hypothetical protein